LYFAQNYTAAIPEYSAFVAEHPESGRAWYRLGYCELKAALYADAAAHFHKADSLKFNPAYTNYNWACALAQLGDLRTSAIKLETGLSNGYPGAQIDSDTDLAPLRTSGEWASLREQLNRYVEPCLYDQRMRELDFWVGVWDVYFLSNNQKAGVNTLTTTEHGCFIHEQWQSESGHSGQSINYFSRADGLWHQTWIDRDGGQVEYTGGLRNGAMVLEGTGNDPGLPPYRARMTMTPLQDGSVEQLMERSSDDGANWYEIFHGIYRRQTE